MGYSGARGTLIYEKNMKSKISCQTPFKQSSKSVIIFMYLRRSLWFIYLDFIKVVCFYLMYLYNGL
jgi:hypothetical protein